MRPRTGYRGLGAWRNVTVHRRASEAVHWRRQGRPIKPPSCKWGHCELLWRVLPKLRTQQSVSSPAHGLLGGLGTSWVWVWFAWGDTRAAHVVVVG